MDDFVEGLYITALGLGVVFLGLVLLAIALRTANLVLKLGTGLRPRGVVGARGSALGPARGRARAPVRIPSLARDKVDAVDDEQAIAAITACLAYILDERGRCPSRGPACPPRL